MQLLQDLSSLLSVSNQRATQQGLWSNCATTTFTKLRSFLPPILSKSDLNELDPQHSSVHALPLLIYNDLRLHNQHITSLHASLELVSSFLKSEVPLTLLIGRDILSVRGDSVPLSWLDSLPKPLGDMASLVSAIKLLRARMAFYQRTLRSGTLPSSLNPLLFSCPQDLVSCRTCRFAMECRQSASSVLAEGKVSA